MSRNLKNPALIIISIIAVMAIFMVIWMTILTPKYETIDDKIENKEFLMKEIKEKNLLIRIDYFDKNRLIAKDYYNELGRIFRREYYDENGRVYSVRYFNYNENAQAIEYYNQANNKTTQIIIPIYPIGGYA